MKKKILFVLLFIFGIFMFAGCGSKTCIVIFDTDGGTKIDSQEIDKGVYLLQPEDPIKEGYNFIGWYNGEEVFDFEVEITKDVTITAKWEKKDDLEYYIEKLDKIGNYEGLVDVTMPLLGQLQISFKVDGNKTWMGKSQITNEVYTEYEEGRVISQYTQNSQGRWVKQSKPGTKEPNEFDAKDFELNNGVYEVKPEFLSKYDAAAITIKLNETLDRATINYSYKDKDGIILPTVIRLFNLGNAPITLPAIN